MYSSTKIVDSATAGNDFNETALKQENVFLFISDKIYDSVTYFEHFHKSFTSPDFNHAKKLLFSDSPKIELIIIDMPLHHLELVEFKVWLTANGLSNIPLIYNESALKIEQINNLFSQKLVDDVVNLQKNYSRLPYKARFIQKLIAGHEQNTKKAILLNAQHGKKYPLIRAIDVLTSGTAILFLLPVFLIVAILVRSESKGPIFYSSLRAGKGFKIFKFFKFRTMIVNADKQISELAEFNLYAGAEKSSNFFKIKDDPRITKIGSFLRNSSLDELPQLFNVLKGDMSLVGNRPLPLYEAATLTTDEWAERFMAPAGITGLWQVSKRGKEEMSNEERISLDIDYARNRSLKGDLKILIKTPAALIQKSNV